MMMNACPICGNTILKFSTVTSRENKNLKLAYCNKCNYRGLDLEYKELYTDGTFSKIAREGNSIPNKSKIAVLDKNAYKRLAFYAKYFSPNQRLLEVGSSAGSMVDALRMFGLKAEGLEPDSGYAEFSKTQYGFEQHSKLIEDFGSDNLYDTICSFHVIEHVDNPLSFIENQWRLLNNSGRILIECPSWEIHSFGNKKHTIWEPHRHYFTRISLYYLLSKYFTQIKTGYYSGALYATGIKRDNASIAHLPSKKQIIQSKICFGFFRTIGWIQFKNPKIQLGKNIALIAITQKGRFKKLTTKSFKFIKHYFKENRFLKREQNKSGVKPPILHFTLYKGWGNNAGDLVLSKAVRDTIKLSQNRTWDIRKLHNKITNSTVQDINGAAATVVGGGGLFLPDTNKNTISNWQWPISKEQLNDIKTPLIGYAIGYNYFPGQNPLPEFVTNLDAFINRCDFIGLRNHGSINAVNNLLNDKYLDKIRFQPCPTTIISHIEKLNIPEPNKNIAINIAFDRYDKRFGSNKNEILLDIGKSILQLQNQGYNIFHAAHLSFDKRFLVILDRLNINYTNINLHQKTAPEIIEFYSRMDLVIGMRGHAQMIPFGLNTMILSLGTHDKMKWFLEDINATDWYIDVRNTESLSDAITQKAIQLFETRKETEERIRFEQNKLFKITKENLEIINEII